MRSIPANLLICLLLTLASTMPPADTADEEEYNSSTQWSNDRKEGSLRVQEPYWRMVLAVFVGRIVFAVLDGCVGFAVYAVQGQSM